MCEFCGWQETVDEIKEFINDDRHRFAFAFDTLDGIKDTIEATHHVTPNQRRAINNIGRKRP